MSSLQALRAYTYSQIIAEICALNWDDLPEDGMVRAAWAYYYFSIQFRENLEIACAAFPDDEKLQQLHKEECNTDNLSPFPGIAAAGEKLNHDEFMARVLTLSGVEASGRVAFEHLGAPYLAEIRALTPAARALSIASYEDRGLERVFKAILRAPSYQTPMLEAFRFFLTEHIRFDSNPDEGHGALSRHMQPDDRIVPLWDAFKRLLIGFAPQLVPAGV